jgi:hypothetical protein
MSSVVSFIPRPAAAGAIKAAGPAAIIIFPGVRYERRAEGEADASEKTAEAQGRN